jgi:hypothetical protein
MLEHVVRNSGNLLLASPSESDAAALRPHLQSVHLDHQRVLFEAGGEVTDIYFPTGAIVFLVAGLSTGEIIETTMVGKDGVVGGVRGSRRDPCKSSHSPTCRTCANVRSE